ncbi:MAG: dodecin domain-containing protein [Calditrichaeota bacterium]|nr:dodecin domain-containing protein [Calditrichota bacterium]
MDSVFKKIEVVGTSKNSIDEAIQNAIAKASESVKEISWFEATEIRGHVSDGRVDQFQVTVKVGFKVMD